MPALVIDSLFGVLVIAGTWGKMFSLESRALQQAAVNLGVTPCFVGMSTSSGTKWGRTWPGMWGAAGSWERTVSRGREGAASPASRQ